MSKKFSIKELVKENQNNPSQFVKEERAKQKKLEDARKKLKSAKAHKEELSHFEKDKLKKAQKEKLNALDELISKAQKKRIEENKFKIADKDVKDAEKELFILNKKKGRGGRRKLEPDEQSSHFNIKLRPNYVKYLNRISKVGFASKIRFILDRAIKRDRRETDVLGLISETIRKAHFSIKRWNEIKVRKYDVSKIQEQAEKVEYYSHKLKLLVDLNCFKHEDMEELLTEEEFKIFELVYEFNEVIKKQAEEISKREMYAN